MTSHDDSVTETETPEELDERRPADEDETETEVDADAEAETDEAEADDDQAETENKDTPAEDADGEEQPADEQETKDEQLEIEPEIELPTSSVVEAILFSARTGLTLKQIARCVRRGTKQAVVEEALEQLNTEYAELNRAFEIIEVAGKWQIMSRPEYAIHVSRLLGRKEKEGEKKLSAAALDTLSIIAYKQPIARVEVERIRGVGCGPMLRQLIERGSIKVVGRKEDVIGQPLLYGTTEGFLKEFGLGSLDELPFLHELRMATGTDEPLPEDNGEEDDDNVLQLVLPDGKSEADESDCEDEDADEDDDEGDADDLDDDEEDEDETDDLDDDEDDDEEEEDEDD